MKKMLMIASVASMIDQFNMTNISILKELGYEVHIAANFEYGNTSSKQRLDDFKNELDILSVPYWQVDFFRNIYNIKSNYKAYKQIISLISNNNYDFIHCQSPIGGVCGRLAAHKTKTKIIYTAHGFHFYKGAPFVNWIFFYPIEKLCAKYTDILITINKEDYAIAQRLGAKRTVYVPGVGIDSVKYLNTKVDKDEKRKQLGITEDAFVLLSVGELSRRKNHEVVIKALAELEKPNLVYLLCGQGILKKKLKDKAKELNVNIMFLGYRNDINEIYAAADLFVFPSLQEGLPVALMEAMSAGLPIVCSKIRGNCDLIENETGGFLTNPNDVNGFSKAIDKIYNSKELREKMKICNHNVMKNFDQKIVEEKLREIYKAIISRYIPNR